jgi:hypothetical protein
VQPGAYPFCDTHAIDGRHPTADNSLQNGGQHPPAILDRLQRRLVDPKPFRRVYGSRRRQYLCGERPQQMRLAVEQIQQRLRAKRPGGEIRHAAPGIANAAWPAARVAGASLREPPAPVASAGRRGIRTKSLKFLDSSPEKQVITGGRRRIGYVFRHQWTSETNEADISVHDTFRSTEPRDFFANFSSRAEYLGRQAEISS